MRIILVIVVLSFVCACGRIENNSPQQSNANTAAPSSSKASTSTPSKPVDPVSYKILKEEVKNDDILNRSIVDTRILVTGKLTKEGLEQTLRDIMKESRGRNMSKIKHPGYISNYIYAYQTAAYSNNPAGWVARLMYDNKPGESKDAQINISADLH